jgi:uncharacterized membrane protein
VAAIEAVPCSGFQTDTCRRVTVRLKSGPDDGTESKLTLGTGGLDPELDVGDQLRVVKNVIPPGAPQPPPDSGALGAQDAYSLVDFERRGPMIWLALAFAALVILFGRLRGALSLVGLAVSLAVVLVFVVPAILDGQPPLAVALFGSVAVMVATIALAHGLGAKSLAAMLGTTVSLGLVVVLALAFTNLTNLTGFSSEEATLLALNGGNVSFEGLLLAGMVIGALGVLDDVTVSQASTVMALRAANPAQPLGALFRRAMDVGRDHVSATVNTLVLAYVGASLPVLLIFSSSQIGFGDAVNLEVVAKEVVAMLVGSIGLIAAVPITTGLAAYLATRLPEAELGDGEPGHAH